MARKQVSLTQWMKDVSAHLKSNGMDSVFYEVKSNQVMNVLGNWNQMNMNEVTEWDKQKQWDNYDKDNLRIFCKFIWDSISNKIWQSLLSKVRPLIYAAFIP